MKIKKIPENSRTNEQIWKKFNLRSRPTFNIQQIENMQRHDEKVNFFTAKKHPLMCRSLENDSESILY